MEQAVRELEASQSAAPRDAPLARYLANLGGMYRSDPSLAAQLDALPFAALPALEATRHGGPTVRLPADDGRAVYAHSRYDPATEARRAVAALPADANPTFVLFGCGLGYHIVEIAARFDQPLIVVVEPELALIKAACCTTDLREALAAGRLLFLTSRDKAALHARLLPRYADVLLGVQFVTLPYTDRCRRAFHADMRGLLADFAAFARMQMVTLVRNARVTARNIAFNLPTYVTQPGIDDLRGVAAGRPAVVVAAGPSLAQALPHLAGLRERAVLIAVQTVFKPLLAHGVQPHFVTSLDFHEVSGEFFRNCGDVGDCTLVAETKATWHVVDRYPGPVRLLHARFADGLLRDAAPRRAGLRSGSTVAHLAFYLAQHLGCDPIILVGQDLAFADGLYYPPGMPIEDIWRPELGRFQTVEMKQWERIVRGRPILRKVPDVSGRTVYSDDQLVSYAEQFESDFATSAARVIHAGARGMRLRGATGMPVAEALARFCGAPLPPDWRPPAPPPLDSNARARAADALDARLAEVVALRDIASQMQALLARLAECVTQPDAFNRLLLRVDELRAGIRRYERTYALVVDRKSVV